MFEFKRYIYNIDSFNILSKFDLIFNDEICIFYKKIINSRNS